MHLLLEGEETYLQPGDHIIWVREKSCLRLERPESDRQEATPMQIVHGDEVSLTYSIPVSCNRRELCEILMHFACIGSGEPVHPRYGGETIGGNYMWEIHSVR